MELDLEGRRAIVTGATSGIGAAVAHRLVQEGAHVLATGRDPERLTRTVEAASAAGPGRIDGLAADLTDPQAAATIAATMAAGFGDAEVLVACAGSYPLGGLLTSPLEDFARLQAINVLPFVALAQRVIPPMQQAGWGRLIAIGDIATQHAVPGAAAYTASKAALVHLALTLSKELADSGITSNVVSPGLIRTEGTERMFGALASANGWPTDWPALEPLLLEHVLPVPVGRAGRPEDIAAAVALLASPAGGYFNGAHLRVDGGATGIAI